MQLARIQAGSSPLGSGGGEQRWWNTVRPLISYFCWLVSFFFSKFKSAHGIQKLRKIRKSWCARRLNQNVTARTLLSIWRSSFSRGCAGDYSACRLIKKHKTKVITTIRKWIVQNQGEYTTFAAYDLLYESWKFAGAEKKLWPSICVPVRLFNRIFRELNRFQWEVEE